jgi:anion-transporting  ArsA/GET3 family ATPase
VVDRRLLFVSGKGGVGKSAVAAALALAAARRGKEVLVVGMTDRLGLAVHFGRDDLPYRPVEVAPGVSGAGVDRARALDEYLRLQAHIPRLAPTAPLSRALNVLVETVPGIREIISIGKPVYEVWSDAWDLVIVDSPPLGQLGSYLRAPGAIAHLVPSGRVKEQAAAMQATLEDPTHSGLLLVTTAEELPATETREASRRIATEATIDIVAIVVNRVVPALGLSAETVAGLPPGPRRDAASLHRGVHGSQQRWLSQFPGAFRLPYLFGMHTPAEVVARLADLVEEL